MSTCTVQVSVQDVNDLPPEFIRLPAGNIFLNHIFIKLE